MVRLLGLAALCGCVPDTTPEWQLDHDRIVAVRATPPRVRPGEVARLDALLASKGGPTFEAQPIGASAATAPGGLFTAVHYNIDHWQIDGPPEEQLDAARAELGLGADAPVPLVVTLEFDRELYAEKIVWLGDTHANPTPSVVAVDDVEASSAIDLASGRTHTLSVEVPDRVRWFTSCGELEDADAATARLTVARSCEGELAVVLRDGLGGVAWRILLLRVQ